MFDDKLDTFNFINKIFRDIKKGTFEELKINLEK
jgi:hypothetical protein